MHKKNYTNGKLANDFRNIKYYRNNKISNLVRVQET